MPQRDRTGPQGKCSRTGRGLGKCNPQGGTPVPQRRGSMGSDRGTGQGAGRGSGQRGRGKGGRKGR